MFENLNMWEVGGLLLVALLIFGDKLPEAIGNGLRMLRNLRAMATNATSDLSRELGTDIQLEDLNPKNFVRKHLLSEEDEAALRRPMQGLLDDVKRDAQGFKRQAQEIKEAADFKAPASSPASRPAATPSYDDAT